MESATSSISVVIKFQPSSIDPLGPQAFQVWAEVTGVTAEA